MVRGQLRQALTSRIWIEQAKGMVAATQGIALDAAFHQLRARARASSRKLAEVAGEVVQDVQRERVAAKARDDARVRAAEARAREAEQALSAAQTGLARRTATLDRAQDDLATRERAADERERVADQRDRTADARNRLADTRERAADVRDQAADHRDRPSRRATRSPTNPARGLPQPIRFAKDHQGEAVVVWLLLPPRPPGPRGRPVPRGAL